ncbi:hypothetical protein [Hydrogenispora ethanolica]|nr:hypothetical protein [Hydrogenispora ethanolica]
MNQLSVVAHTIFERFGGDKAMRFQEEDHFMFWAIAGCLGQIVRDIFGYLVVMAGLVKSHIWNLAADLFFNGSVINTFGGLLIGALVNYVAAGSTGVITGLLLEWRGTKHYLFKGIGVTLLAWLFIFGLVVHSLPEVFKVHPQEPLDVFFSFLGHMILGAITSWLITRFTGPAAQGERSLERHDG